MKKFKIEKSRNTLWREARVVAELQPAGDEVGLVYDDAAFDMLFSTLNMMQWTRVIMA